MYVSLIRTRQISELAQRFRESPMREFGAGEGQSVSVEGKRGKGRSREVQIGSNGGQTQAVNYVERGDKAATGVT